MEGNEKEGSLPFSTSAKLKIFRTEKVFGDLAPSLMLSVHLKSIAVFLGDFYFPQHSFRICFQHILPYIKIRRNEH